MDILKTMFVKDQEPDSPGTLLTYKVKDGNKTDLFQKNNIIIRRDTKYYKNTVAINFGTGLS